MPHAGPRGTLILDFDGTITQQDLGDAFCTRFGDPDWRRIDAAWLDGTLTLPEAQRRIWGSVTASPEALMAFALEAGTLRPGFAAFCDTATGLGFRLILASGGFDFYIRAILGPMLDRFSATYYNEGRLVDDGVALGFPHTATLGCERCAICKGRVCDSYRTGAGPVVFIGDGSSDRCAVGRADHLAAVRGSLLARTCRAAKVVPCEFETFTELIPHLEGWSRQPDPLPASNASAR